MEFFKGDIPQACYEYPHQVAMQTDTLECFVSI